MFVLEIAHFWSNKRVVELYNFEFFLIKKNNLLITGLKKAYGLFLFNSKISFQCIEIQTIVVLKAIILNHYKVLLVKKNVKNSLR